MRLPFLLRNTKIRNLVERISRGVTGFKGDRGVTNDRGIRDFAGQILDS